MLNACLTREKRSLMGRTRGWLKDRSRAVLCVPIVVLAVLLLGGPVSVFAVSATTAPETTGIPWTRQFGTPSSDFASAISATADGAFVAGDTLGTLPGETSAGDDDAFVRRYNADGDVLWTRQFGTESYETAWAVSTTADGVYVAGESGGALSGETNAGKSDAFVRRYNADGDVLWTRQFGPSTDVSSYISATEDSVYVAGNTRGTLPGQTKAGRRDAFIRRIVLYHPDALISRAANKGFVGNNIYNDSGARQSRSTRVTPRATRTFYLRVENDGDASHPIALQGCQDKRGFAVRYLRGAAGTTDITTEVIAGTYAPRIAPWKSVMVRLVIKVKAAAEAGARITCRVTVTSEPADDHNDTVRAKVKVS
jgi:hypothetical protein